MSCLIYSGVHCQTEENRELVKLWARLTRYLNPDALILILDSLSPFDPIHFIPDDLGIRIHRYQTNPGHLSQGGGDGAGRTFCDGIHWAKLYGCDYAVHLESDMLLAKPLAPLIDKMQRHGTKAAACYLTQYQFFEFGICAMNVEHMIATKFTERYDWENAPKWPIPELRIAELLDGDLWIIPWHGARNDQHQIKAGALNLAFPYAAPDWMTHMNLEVARSFLQANGLEAVI